MADVQHVFTGEGNPNGSVLQASLGAHYIDVIAGVAWTCVAAGTEGVSDAVWERPSGGASSGVIVSDEVPETAPPAVGARWIQPWGCEFVAMADTCAEDWVAVTGPRPGAGTTGYSSFPGDSTQLPRSARDIEVTVDGPAVALFTSTLLMPAWENTPVGWTLRLEPRVAQVYRLAMDFQSSGTGLSVAVKDYATSTVIDVTGAVLTLEVGSPVTALIKDFWVEEDTVSVVLELRPLELPTSASYSS